MRISSRFWRRRDLLLSKGISEIWILAGRRWRAWTMCSIRQPGAVCRAVSRCRFCMRRSISAGRLIWWRRRGCAAWRSSSMLPALRCTVIPRNCRRRKAGKEMWSLLTRWRRRWTRSTGGFIRNCTDWIRMDCGILMCSGAGRIRTACMRPWSRSF